MRRAIFHQYGRLDDIAIVEDDLPLPAPQEVLVRVIAAGINPKDVLIKKGKFRRLSGRKFPQGVGFDFCGRIEDPNGSNYAKGQLVFGMLNGWRGRSCADYLAIPTNEISAAPSEISPVDLAGIPLAGQTALQSLRNVGRLKPGDKVCINGASGGVGTLAIQIATILRGDVTSVSSSRNTALCSSLGAQTTIAYDHQKLSDHRAKFDVFFDVFGNFSYRKALPLLTPRGRYVTTVPKPAIFGEQVLNPLRKRKARMVVVRSNREDLSWLSEKLSTGELQPVTDKTLPLEGLVAAEEYLTTKRAVGKVIITLESP